MNSHILRPGRYHYRNPKSFRKLLLSVAVVLALPSVAAILATAFILQAGTYRLVSLDALDILVTILLVVGCFVLAAFAVRLVGFARRLDDEITIEADSVEVREPNGKVMIFALSSGKRVTLLPRLLETLPGGVATMFANPNERAAVDVRFINRVAGCAPLGARDEIEK